MTTPIPINIDTANMSDKFLLFIKNLQIIKQLLEQLEYKLVDLIQKENNQVHTQIEKLNITNEERLQFEEERQRLIIGNRRKK